MRMKRTFRIDLAEIEGDGAFSCPGCAEVISPDDESGITYDILDVKTKEPGVLEEVVIQCKKCGSMILLTGFEALIEVAGLDY